jgi:hypothetical protein
VAGKGVFLIALLFVACGGKEAIKQMIDETRAPVRIVIEIRLDETAMPNEKELQLRQHIAEAIEHEHIGLVARSTADIGHMDLGIDVKDSVKAIPVIHDVLRRFNVDDRAIVRVDETHS